MMAILQLTFLFRKAHKRLLLDRPFQDYALGQVHPALGFFRYEVLLPAP
jgi:hypothetical protein